MTREVDSWLYSLLVTCVDVRCSRNDNRSLLARPGLCDNFFGLCVFFSLHIGLLVQWYVWSWSSKEYSRTTSFLNTWHLATAHLHSGSSEIPLCSKQKRGWAFIQDGLIFARVRYSNHPLVVGHDIQFRLQTSNFHHVDLHQRIWQHISSLQRSSGTSHSEVTFSRQWIVLQSYW